MLKRLVAAFTVILVIGVAAPAGAEPQGFIEGEFEYGWFYGTFDESPNVALFAGGTLEEFCFADPGTAKLRTFLRNDGSVDLKVNDKDQPIYLYLTDFNDIPVWLDAVCPGIAEGAAAPEPFASGMADTKVRISEGTGDRVEIFNSVNGKATGTDGTSYKVRGTADYVVEGGELVGDPRDLVGFKLIEIGR
jgi:hypothetical protein